ncbi:hypothetical protein CR513_56923, partial [Mucuna pruriens]
MVRLRAIRLGGINFNENFTLIARLEAMCILLSFATHYHMTLHQINIKCAFLNDIIMKKFIFESDAFPKHVFKLKKAFYGLEQAPHAWYGKLSSFLMSIGFERGKVDTTLFCKTTIHILLLCKYIWSTLFLAKDGIYIHQTKYVKELLKKFNLEDFKSMSTPMYPTSILTLDE